MVHFKLNRALSSPQVIDYQVLSAFTDLPDASPHVLLVRLLSDLLKRIDLCLRREDIGTTLFLEISIKVVIGALGSPNLENSLLIVVHRILNDLDLVSWLSVYLKLRDSERLLSSWRAHVAKWVS